MSNQKLYIAAEHSGVALKKYLIENLAKENLELVDLYNIDDPQDDYPDVAKILATKLLQEKDALGVTICGSGQGICIAMNRFSHVRAGLLRTESDAVQVREHGNGNCACFGANVTSKEDCVKILLTFIKTNSSTEDRHTRRVKKMSQSDYNKI